MRSSSIYYAAIWLGTSIASAVSSPHAAQHELVKRQFDLSGIMQGLSGSIGRAGASPVKKETLPPTIRKDAVRERLWLGPFTLPAANEPRAKSVGLAMDPMGVQISRVVSGFCSNCTVLYGKSSLLFENGTKATADRGVYEHHIVVLELPNKNLPFYLCKGQGGRLGQAPATGFIISGNDEAANYFTTPDGKFNSGYLFKKNPNLMMQAELVNYRPESLNVFVTLEYEYVVGHPNEPADSTVSLFSVTGCKTPDYHPKERVYNMTSDAVPIPRDGYIINAKGHLHDGGDHIVLSLNGKVICDSKAIYGKGYGDSGGVGGMMGHSHGRRFADPPSASDGNWEVITEMTQCTEPIKVKKGDLLSMTSFYDGVKHPPRPTRNHEGKKMEADEMGVFFLNFAGSDKPLDKLQVDTSLLIGKV